MATFIRKEKLKTIMKSKKFKVAELAIDIGVSRIYIYRIMNENLPVGPKFVEGLLKKTGYKFEELFYFAEELTKNELDFNAIAPETLQVESLSPCTYDSSSKSKSTGSTGYSDANQGNEN